MMNLEKKAKKTLNRDIDDRFPLAHTHMGTYI